MLAADKKPRDPSTKSASSKRQKEIQYAKIMLVQQYFRAQDIKGQVDEEEAPIYKAEAEPEEAQDLQNEEAADENEVQDPETLKEEVEAGLKKNDDGEQEEVDK